jgi:hypothetical protein
MADPAILASGMSLLRSEWDRGVPVKYQTTFELALELAAKGRVGTVPVKRESLGLDSHRAVSRKGGKAPRKNALNDLIQELAVKYKKITTWRLLRQLTRLEGHGTIVSIDSESDVLEGDVRKIHYQEEDGTPKTASVYGLKDRLARIKRKISRNKSH